MEKNAKGLLPKVEVIIVAVFALSFLVWIVPKCGGERAPAGEIPEDLLLADSAKAATAKDSTSKTPLSTAKDTTAKVSPATSPAKPELQYSKLYITIDGLNLRSEPGLKSTVLAKLPLFDEVYFLNQVSDSTSELSIGYEKVREPWVKVRTKKGQEGWVFGAGVNYYKKKREGTLE